MRKLLKEILFSGILIVILLHVLIPHPHSDELTAKEHLKIHQNSKTVFGFLELVFHESNDENLDDLIVANYQINKTFNTKFRQAIIADNSESTRFATLNINKLEQLNLDINKKCFIVKPNGTRGSPLPFSCL